MMDATETAGLTKLCGAARGIVDVDSAFPVGSVFAFSGDRGAHRAPCPVLVVRARSC
jgi:hypothetical protein